ncbi:MAG: TolC family protein [Candidatus Aminicenantaceae bacterium]
MTKKVIIVITVGFLFLAAGIQAEEKQDALSLSLEDCVLKALENNLDLAIEIYEPELAELNIMSTREMFIPDLSFNISKRETNSASYSWLDASDQVSTVYDNYSAEISQLIPTGGTLSISIDGYKNETNRKFQTINPRFGDTLRFDFSQPLLKDFGFKITRKDIIVASNNLDTATYNLKSAIIDTIYNIEEAYWDLVYKIEILKVRKQSLKLARDLLEKNRRAVAIGTKAPIDIIDAKAAVASREADIIQAEADVKNSEDTLRALMNIAAEDKLLSDVHITPSGKPSYEKKNINLDSAILTAMENRTDLKVSKINIQNEEINLNYAKNQLLPSLNLNASYWSPGISGTQLVYPPGEIFREPIAIIPGTAADALKDAFGFKYQNWSIGISLDIPLNSVFSRANYISSKIELERAKLNLENQEQSILLEIKNSVRAVETNFRRLNAYKAARELAVEKLEAEEDKFKVGLSTNYQVLEYQSQLATAQTNELKAIIDYNLSLANLNKVMGITLEEKNIKIADVLSR